MLDTTYHCHTRFSDGETDVHGMVTKAAELGFREIGISDHLVLHPQNVCDYTMAPEQLPQYVAAVTEAAARTNITVKLGLEIDFFPEQAFLSRIQTYIDTFKPAYVIGSVHYVDTFPIDRWFEDWQPLTIVRRQQMFVAYWERIIAMVESGLFDVVGHLDLPKKLLQPPDPTALVPLVDRALTAIARRNMWVELNTAGWDKHCAMCYPEPDILARCRSLDIPVTVNDDAHSPDQLGRHYSEAEELLARLNMQPVKMG